jgi:hypothetical protein
VPYVVGYGVHGEARGPCVQGVATLGDMRTAQRVKVLRGLPLALRAFPDAESSPYLTLAFVAALAVGLAMA